MISQLADRILEILLALAGLLLTYQGLKLQARGHKRQEQASQLEGLLNIVEAYRKEWERQESLIETLREHNRELEKRVLEARHREAVWKQRLEATNNMNVKGDNNHAS